MTLPTSRLQDVLPLLPTDIHEKTISIYQQIPGSLLNYLNAASIDEKTECRESHLPVDSLITIGYDTERNSHDSASEYHHPTGSLNSSFNDQSPSTSSYSACSMHEKHDNKYENALRFYLLRSIKRSFDDQNIIGIDSARITDNIVRNCFEQCADWGSEKCNRTSVNVRFNSNYIIEHKSRLFNVNIYSYAHLACERKEPYFPLFCEGPPQINFEVAIGLTGLAISSDKIVQFRQMLSNNTVIDVIKQIETTNKIAWENFNPPDSK